MPPIAISERVIQPRLLAARELPTAEPVTSGTPDTTEALPVATLRWKRGEVTRVSIRWSFAAALAVVALTSGCGSAASLPSTTERIQTGVVSGVAAPCEGPWRPQTQYEAIPVLVQLVKNSRVVAMQTVVGSHIFRFAASPGEYVVRSNQSATSPAPVTITAGATTTVNIYSACP